MLKTFIQSSILLTAIITPSLAFAYGEGGQIPEGARAIHLLTNEARCNVKEALANCNRKTDCREADACFKDGTYSEVMNPMYWNNDLYRAAQFHANMISYIDCQQHNSPCILTSTAASDFPDICDGNPKCACKNGKATCSDTGGTETFSRIAKFGTSGNGENIAPVINPLESFELWLFESSNTSKCEFGTNGHRMNILGSFRSIGVGYADYTVQDFSNSSSTKYAITSASHYKDGKTLWFKLHYASNTGVQRATLSINHSCSELTKTRGTEQNGVYGTSTTSAPAKCTPYVFEVLDQAGNIIRYPSTGSLLYHCDNSWTSDETSSCIAKNPDPVEPDPGNTEPGSPDPGNPDSGNTEPSSPDPENPDSGNTEPEDSAPDAPDTGSTNPDVPSDESPENANTSKEDNDTQTADSPDEPTRHGSGNPNAINLSDSPQACSGFSSKSSHSLPLIFLFLPCLLAFRRKAGGPFDANP